MVRGVILDLDGTVYLGTDEVPGASRFVAAMHTDGVRCLFVTNRANRTPEEIVGHLRGYGIACSAGDVLTSAQATVQYLKPGRVYFIGEQGLQKELVDAGFTLTQDRPDYVIVSYDRQFTYEKLRIACNLIDAGAKFVATNPDRALRTESGISPGTGPLVAAVAAGSGREPLVIGKPERFIIDIAVARLGMPREHVMLVGDSLATDVPAGRAAGVRSALILTGVSRREEIARAPAKPDWVVDSFDELLSVVRRENGAAA